MNRQERYAKLSELIKEFKNGEELYKRSPIFNVCIQQMLEGATIHEVFEDVIKIHERTNNAFSDYVTRDARPIYINKDGNN